MAKEARQEIDLEDDASAPQSSVPAKRSVPGWLTGLAAVGGRLIVVAVAGWIVAWVLGKVALVVISVLVALLLTAVLAPVADRLDGVGLHRGVAAFVTLIVMIGVVIGLVLLVGMRLVQEAPQLADQLTTALNQLQRALPRTQAGSFDLITQRLQQGPGQYLGTVLSGVRTLAALVAGIALVLVLTFFFTRDGRSMWLWLLDRLDDRVRDDVDVGGRAAWEILSRYVRGLLIIATIDAVGIGLGLLVIGVPLVLTLTVLTFVGSFVPLVGAFTAGLVAVAVAFVSGGLTQALLALAVVVGVQQLEGNVLEPLVYGRALPLHPAVVAIALAVGALLVGIAGALLAVPLAAAASAAGHALRVHHQRDEPTPSRVPVSAAGRNTSRTRR